jgi:hypothetical protein
MSSRIFACNSLVNVGQIGSVFAIFVSPGGNHINLAKKVVNELTEHNCLSYIVVADTLYRHNYANNKSKETALRKSIEYGEHSVNVWSDLSKDIDHMSFYRWDDVLQLDSQKICVDHMKMELYDNPDGEFSNLVKNWSLLSLQRKKIKQKERTIKNSINYIVEELPTILFRLPELYPNQMLSSEYVNIHATTFSFPEKVMNERNKFIMNIKNLEFINQLSSSLHLSFVDQVIDVIE